MLHRSLYWLWYSNIYYLSDNLDKISIILRHSGSWGFCWRVFIGHVIFLDVALLFGESILCCCLMINKCVEWHVSCEISIPVVIGIQILYEFCKNMQYIWCLVCFFTVLYLVVNYGDQCRWEWGQGREWEAWCFNITCIENKQFATSYNKGKMKI